MLKCFIIMKWNLLNCSSMRLTHHWHSPYVLYVPACLRPFTLINKHFTRLFCLVLCCFNWKARYLCFVCGLKLTLTPSLSFLSFYHIKLFYMFRYFKPLVTTLSIQLIWNNIFIFSVLFFLKECILKKTSNFHIFKTGTLI